MKRISGAKNKLLVLLLTSVCLFPLLVTSSLSQSVKPLVPTPAKPSDSEVSYLRGQLEQMKATDDSLISTVHWSLGAIAGLAVLILTTNWYVNLKLTARDKKAIHEELTKFIEQSHSEHKLKLKEEVESSIRVEIEKLGKVFDNRFEVVHKSIHTSFYAHLGNIVTENLKNGDIETAAKNFSLMLMLAISLKNEDYITQSIDSLKHTLQKLSSSTAKTTAFISQTIKKLPDKYSHEAGVLNELLRKAGMPAK